MLILQKLYYSETCLEFSSDPQECERWEDIPIKQLTGKWKIIREEGKSYLFVQRRKSKIFNLTEWIDSANLRLIDRDIHINECN